MDETYIGMSSKHLVTEARKHLNLNKNGKSAIKGRLQQRRPTSWSKTEINLYWSFTVLKKCSSEHSAIIHEVLLIRQSKQLLNKQLYADDCSFLLKVFQFTWWMVCQYSAKPYHS